MTVRALWTGGQRYQLSIDGYRPKAELSRPARDGEAGGAPSPAAAAACRHLLDAAAACCDAAVAPAQRGDALEVEGDPTEVALLVAAVGLGAQPAAIGRDGRRLGEVPFESEHRTMAVLLPAGRTARSVVKGAPDAVLDRCTRLRGADGIERALGPAERAQAQAAADAMAADALRVLAVAERGELRPDSAPHTWQEGLTLVGLVGMMDPPRPEAARAVARCRQAGIRVVMITGDHPQTAGAVARELGIAHGEDEVATGRDLDAWDDERLTREVGRLRVLARVTPRHKLRVVRALRRSGEIVAMTGDGVNDAPAVKEADVGIAMGVAGTDVTKEAAAIVLADDNFATIAAAIEEGRSIYDNVRKFIRYLLACNTGEVLTMFLAAALGAPMPLLPIQILWVNLVTDGLPALALGLEPADPDAMHRPPRAPSESIFAHGLGTRIGLRGALIGAVTLGLFLLSLRTGHSLAYARTAAFAALTLQQLAFVFECRRESAGGAVAPLRANPWLPLAVVASFGLFALTVYVPAVRPIFGTVALSTDTWLWVLVGSVAPTLLTLAGGLRRAVPAGAA